MSEKTILIYKKSNLIGKSGGIEKFISWFSNALTEKGYRVVIATRDKREGELFYPINSDVLFYKFHIHFSKVRRMLGKIGFRFIPYFNRERYISNLIRSYCEKIKPDIIITEGIQDLSDIVYCNAYSCPKIVQLHGFPDVFFTKKKRKLFERVLKYADAVQVLLPSFIQNLRQHYNGKITVISNPIFKNKCIRQEQPIIIYPARVEKEKQQHLLIEAFSKIAHLYPEWQVHCWGELVDNDYKEKCKELILKSNLEKQVKFMGVTREMDKKLSESSICAFPSRFEGFGFGLLEGMSAGLPCIGFENAPGVCDQISNGVNGFLVKDCDDFSQKLESLIRDKSLRQKMGSHAQKNVEKYCPENILKQWIEFIEKIVNNRK